MTHLEIGGTIGGAPITLCGTKNKKNPLKLYQEGDSPWKTWDGTFINGPTCTKCYFKREFMLNKKVAQICT
jgi:hypothetical protein